MFGSSAKSLRPNLRQMPNMSAPLCHCDPPESAVKRVAGMNSKHQGREYWSCPSCDFFQWIDHGGTTLSAAGPLCRCGHPSALKMTRKDGPTRGREFWSCASTGNCGCNFFQWESSDWEGSQEPLTVENNCKKCRRAVQVLVVGENNQNGNAGRKYYKCNACSNFEFLTAAKPQAPPSACTPGSAEYVVDEMTRRQLQRLFDIPYGTTTGVGRDQQEVSSPYDYLKVECAWRVRNPQREKRFEEFLRKLPKLDKDAMVKSKLFETQGALLSKPLNASKNEMLLLHGTKPNHLYNILFEGLDPHLSEDGIFGKGSYLAEDAAKVDQYLTKDPEWKGHAPGHELCALHKKLYDRNVKHATDVYYALVCRTALGELAVTKDGTTCVESGKAIFEDRRRKTLKQGKTSILAELGKKIRRFREFVVLDPAALSIEFLVALKRVRHYCDCGQTAVQRTVTNGLPENFGRDILFCPLGRADGCGFIHMLPQCYCGRAAEVADKRNGEKYFRCGKRLIFQPPDISLVPN
ncbi:unnamed protein product [Durusdinium trenchii]|uniref:GRF-type domain-containing protein n=1 Tax=Durusdinium trenchii TaxID=1381693 RepID=A0ABP0RAI9_9DINO